MTKPKTGDHPDLKMVNPNAAAIGIGSRMHMAAVNPDANIAPVRAFGTFTQDLRDLASWLQSCGFTSVAIESTGVYWIPAFEILEDHGFAVILVNARYAKNVPGRKTDVSDAGWLRQLHSYGLLRGSFHPEAEIATLRTYMRQRERLTEYAAAHIQHMQKALMEMNLQLHHVVSDITGVTGMRIIRAIVGGERDPEVLAAFRDVRCKSSMDMIKAALIGNDREEHVFALTQSLELYDFYKAQIEACDRRLEAAVGALTVRAHDDLAPLPKAWIKDKQHNAPSFDVRAALNGVLGTDLTQIHGLGPSLALKLVAECGTDLRAWESAKHFTSWLCLALGNKISGGKMLSSRTHRSSSRAAALLRLAAVTIGRSDTTLGAFYRRLSSRIGKQKAVTATARKIAVLFYNAIRHGMTYQDQGAAAYDKRHQATRAVKPPETRQDHGICIGAHSGSRGYFLGSNAFLRGPKAMRFRFIEEHSGSFQTERLCRIMDVSPRGLRAFRSRPASRRQRSDLVILAHIKEQSRLSLGSYGRPRMTEELKELDLDVGHRRVGRLMRQNGISVVRTRKHEVTTIARQAIATQSAERGTATTSSTLRRTCWIGTSQ